MLDLIVDDTVKGRLADDEVARLESEVARMVLAAGLEEEKAEELEMTLRLTGDECMREFNRDFRGVDKATDVLAFAAREAPSARHHPNLLGDILISLDTAAGQSAGPLVEEVIFLASHGLCHLLGYDHRDDEEEAEMNARMRALRTEGKRRGPTNAA